MKIVPIKNTVICERCESEKKTNPHVLVSRTDVIETYRIIDYSVDDKTTFPFEIGDEIIVSGTGDEVEVDGKMVNMFMTDHVVAKVIN